MIALSLRKMRFASAAFGTLVLLSLLGCASKNSAPITNAVTNSVTPLTSSQQKAALFEDAAARAGLKWQHQLGATGKFYFIESTPSGCAFLDFDNDGWQDIFLVQSGAPAPQDKTYQRPFCALYRNRGDGTFADVTRDLGLNQDLGYAQGVTVGDYDNDGFDDLFVTAYGRNTLLHNDGGKRFRDVTRSMQLPQKYGTGYATSAAWGDYDNDGKLDLYVCHYAQWTPRDQSAMSRRAMAASTTVRRLIYQPESDRLYRNEGARFP